ncbi:MAG: HlyD family efflux transporter periplasmic adaptor subunit [Lentisphaerae bacterium]|nr:HlyD family efflux transporter periplasmic adaptor subunit [Lentisphaerota bacterium]
MIIDLDSRMNFQRQIKIIQRLVIALVVVMIAVIAGTFIFSMNDESIGRGTVEGLRNYDMKSSVKSRIAKLHFRDGDMVKAGTVMLELDSSALQDAIENVTYRIRELEAELAVKLAALELLKHDPLPAEYRHTKIALEESRLRLATSQAELNAYKALRKRGVIAELDYNRHEMEVSRNKMELEKLQNDYATLSSGLAGKIIARAEAEIDLLKTRIENCRNELISLNNKRREYLFIAPEDGQIAYIPTKIGTYVEPGMSVIQFAAGNGRKFIAYIDEVEIFKIEEGQSVRIASSQYSIYEYGYFNGEVMYISELPQERAGRVYYPVYIKVTHAPDDKLVLRLGSSGEARISTGRDRIIRTIMGTNRKRRSGVK